MQSPIARMQRQFGHADRLSDFGRLGAGLALAGFGNTLTQSAVTGVKTGVTGATVSTAIGTGVASAIGAGAAAGSFIPIIGTAIGAIIGLVASGVFNHRVDPEVGNFNNAEALFKTNPNGIFNIADKYLVLAGLFDLLPNQIKGNIPIYKKYGRMGEQRFTQDMANQIYNAAQAGVIGPNDTPQTVMNKVVQPWIDGFGFGQMQDSNAEMITDILTGMIAEYVTGLWKTRWFARAGDMPNWQIPVFSLPTGAGVAPTASGTPTQAPPPLIIAPAQSVQPAQSTVQIPAGFTVGGTDAATGIPLYLGPDGRWYSWNGVTMSLFSGTGFIQGQALGIQSGVVSQALNTGTIPTAQPVNPLLFGSPAPTIITVPGTAPQNTAAQPIAAGVTGAGLPSWVTWGAIGGVVLVLFATARPVGGSQRRRK